MSLFDKLQSNRKTKIDEEKNAGAVFLSENKKREGVIGLPSGIQYEILQQGNGDKPNVRDKIKAHYAGRLLNGKEFDSSYKRGQPATFQVSAVIPGWTQALKMMKPGATWELYIPASLAYGDQGAPPVIGPNQALIFKVHLIKVTK